MKYGVGTHDPQGHSEDKKAPTPQIPQPEGGSSGSKRCLNSWLFVAMQDGGVARKKARQESLTPQTRGAGKVQKT